MAAHGQIAGGGAEQEADGDGNDTGAKPDHNTAQRRKPDILAGENIRQWPGQTGNRDRGERRANPEDAGGDPEGVTDAAEPAMGIGTPGDPALPCLTQGKASETEEDDGDGTADHHLEHGEEDGTDDVEVQPQRLVDRHFKRRRPRTAAKRENDGEAGECEEKGEHGDARQNFRNAGPLDQPEDRPRGHAELRCQPPRLSGNGLPGRQQQAHGKRYVEEGVGNENALESVDRTEPPHSDRSQRGVDGAILSPHGHHPEHGDDGRQDQRDAEEADHDAASRKDRTARQGPGKRNGEHKGKAPWRVSPGEP